MSSPLAIASCLKLCRLSPKFAHAFFSPPLSSLASFGDVLLEVLHLSDQVLEGALLVFEALKGEQSFR